MEADETQRERELMGGQHNGTKVQGEKETIKKSFVKRDKLSLIDYYTPSFINRLLYS